MWPLGTLAGTPWSLDGDVARGPGCFDMTAGLVLVFHALAALGGADADELDGVTVFVSGDEELGSPTASSLFEAEAGRGGDHPAVVRRLHRRGCRQP